MSDSRAVIVVGAGMAGLTAALAAGEAGSDVLVLESEPAVGGSMALSGGLIWGPATLELARRWIPRGNPELQRLLVDELGEVWSWLEGHGTPLDPPVACLKDRMGRGRLMAVGGPGARGPWAQTLLAATERHGVEVLVESRVETVEPGADEWTVTWARAGSRSSAAARAVIFCGGGFQNSTDLVRRYISPWPEKMIVRSNRSSDGVALRNLLPLGAALSHGMHSFYGHSLPAIEGKVWDNGLEFLAGSLYFSDFCLIVNQLGLRFTDESVGCIDEHNAERGCQQPEGRYYVIFDERIRREYIDVDLMGIPGIEATRVPEKLVQLRELGASIVSADTPDELAAAMDAEFGVPAANVTDTLRTYNTTSDPLHALDPPRRRDHAAIIEPPLRAVACVAGITYTMGGLKVDQDMRVLGNGLAGAFAAGADAGNVFEDVYGGGLGWAAVSGRRAGRAAAAT
ncbi:MAG TPA: FAD-dependent oxidoreductase [Solirubrobacteraceae bacterium]|nr:FAD-dependent oxidoreductase [Solirubrobacteraceae bacterium]